MVPKPHAAKPSGRLAAARLSKLGSGAAKDRQLLPNSNCRAVAVSHLWLSNPQTPWEPVFSQSDCRGRSRSVLSQRAGVWLGHRPAEALAEARRLARRAVQLANNDASGLGMAL